MAYIAFDDRIIGACRQKADLPPSVSCLLFLGDANGLGVLGIARPSLSHQRAAPRGLSDSEPDRSTAKYFERIRTGRTSGRSARTARRWQIVALPADRSCLRNTADDFRLGRLRAAHR